MLIIEEMPFAEFEVKDENFNSRDNKNITLDLDIAINVTVDNENENLVFMFNQYANSIIFKKPLHRIITYIISKSYIYGVGEYLYREILKMELELLEGNVNKLNTKANKVVIELDNKIIRILRKTE